MTTKQKALRQYLFRALVAKADAAVCGAGDGPLVLSWREARNMWRGATMATILKTDRKAGLQ